MCTVLHLKTIATIKFIGHKSIIRIIHHYLSDSGTICHPCQRDKGKYNAHGTHYDAQGLHYMPEGSIMWPVGGIFSCTRGRGQHIHIII